MQLDVSVRQAHAALDELRGACKAAALPLAVDNTLRSGARREGSYEAGGTVHATLTTKASW